VSCLAVTGETTGRQCWEVHKDAVTGIIEKHIKDPAMVNRLADAWNSAVDLGVTTAKASPAQKKKKTDRAIRLTYVRQATSVLLSQIGLIACKWCVYRGLHDCCLTTKKQFGQLGDSQILTQCCGWVRIISRARLHAFHTPRHFFFNNSVLLVFEDFPCVYLLLQYLLESCSRGGREIVEDMCCFERRRAGACVVESAHQALVNAGEKEIV